MATTTTTGPVQAGTLKLQRGLLLAGLATFCWSTTGIFIDQLVNRYHLTPVEISTWRGLLVTPALAGFMRLFQPAAFQLSRREVPYYLLYGLIGIAIFNVIWSTSVEVNRAAVATALIFSSPVFVALGGWWLFREKLKNAQIGAIGINLIGCALVAGITNPVALISSPAGLVLGLMSGLTFGAYTLFGKGAARMGQRNSLTILFYVFLFATIILLAFGLLTEGSSLLLLRMDWVGWLLLIVLSLGPTLAGYAFFTASLHHLPAALASMCSTLEPPITAVLSLLFLGRSMNGVQWLGTTLIVSGVVIMQATSFKWRSSNSNQPQD